MYPKSSYKVLSLSQLGNTNKKQIVIIKDSFSTLISLISTSFSVAFLLFETNPDNSPFSPSPNIATVCWLLEFFNNIKIIQTHKSNLTFFAWMNPFLFSKWSPVLNILLICYSNVHSLSWKKEGCLLKSLHNSYHNTM